MQMVDRQRLAIDSIVSRIIKEIKEVSVSDEFYEQTARFVAHKLVERGYDNPDSIINGIEADAFVVENIDKCIKQMVSNIMGSYELRLCKGKR